MRFVIPNRSNADVSVNHGRPSVPKRMWKRKTVRDEPASGDVVMKWLDVKVVLLCTIYYRQHWEPHRYVVYTYFAIL